jgi:hypothetical protein
MKLILTILVLLLTQTVFGQHDSFRFLNKNHKLNRNYEVDLENDKSHLFVATQRGRKNLSDNREILNIYPVRPEGDPRFMNPDIIEVRYEYRRFDMGNLIPNILRPVRSNP